MQNKLWEKLNYIYEMFHLTPGDRVVFRGLVGGDYENAFVNWILNNSNDYLDN